MRWFKLIMSSPLSLSMAADKPRTNIDYYIGAFVSCSSCRWDKNEIKTQKRSVRVKADAFRVGTHGGGPIVFRTLRLFCLFCQTAFAHR